VHDAVAQTLRAAALANDAALSHRDGRWQLQGDPTEGALIASAYKGGLAGLREQCARLDSLPFESQHQYMATLHRTKTGTALYLKGAVEVILSQSNEALDAAGQGVALEAEAVQSAADQMAAKGLRVLAFARREFPADKAGVSHDDVNCCMTFLGLQGMIDPPRAEAIEAVRASQAAGIRVKMITGDHALTAAAIAQQIGLQGAAPKALTGKDLSGLSDEQLIEAADRTAVFARVSPEQKLRLVEALQARGHGRRRQRCARAQAGRHRRGDGHHRHRRFQRGR
jgi:Ca2+-transporting ATPase